MVSIAPEYRDWLEAHAPEMHYRAMFPNVLPGPLVEEAKARGETLAYRSPNLIFLPREELAPIAVPPPLAGRRVGADFHGRHVASNEFNNALGEPGDDHVASIWRFGFALFEDDTPVVVAGAYDDGGGLLEIGVDVARSHRGTGLARGRLQFRRADRR